MRGQSPKQLRDLANSAVLLFDRGDLYVSPKVEGELPEVWSNGGAFVCRFMYRGDAEAFVAVFNALPGRTP